MPIRKPKYTSACSPSPNNPVNAELDPMKNPPYLKPKPAVNPEISFEASGA